MGIFDIFKRKSRESSTNYGSDKAAPKSEGTSAKIENDTDKRYYDIAFANTKFEEAGYSYSQYKKKLKNFGYDDTQFLDVTIGLIFILYYRSEKKSVMELFDGANIDYPNNLDLLDLFIELICTINIDNDIEFVKKYRAQKSQRHDYSHWYQMDYQKGLELKSMNYNEEAIDLWKALNRKQEFAWNYYQIGILQNTMGSDECFQNIRKGIGMDDAIKEDAKTYSELDNLRENPEFLALLK